MIEIGSTLGGYRIEGIIGQGGMGVVYRATQLRLHRTVALKVIAPELANDPSFRERFDRESTVTASIDHPHVVPVHEANELDGLLYIVMRYVEGQDLGSVISDSGRLDPARAARLTAQVGAALDAAHLRGMVHRDVKPGNILVSGRPPEEHVYLTDFGLTKQMASDEGLTKTGEWVGTLDYVAPEQIEGRMVDARTDVYALGCVLYEALTGQVPFQRDSSVAKMFAHMNDPAPPMADMVPILPSALDEVVRRAMAKDPADRYPSAGDFGRAAVAAAAGGAPAVPERTVAVGEAAPADATRASAQPDQTVRSPEPKPVQREFPAPPEPQAPAPATPAAPAGLPPQPPPPREAARGGGVNWGLVIAGIVVLLLAGGAVAAVLGGGLEGDKESSTVGVRDGGAGPEVTDESATEPEAKTERSPDAAAVADAPCRNGFITSNQRAQLSEAIGTTEAAVQGTVFYGDCEGDTWALATFPEDSVDGVFRRVGDSWEFIGPISEKRCVVPQRLLQIWKQPSC